mgnify:CR=1 FL=1
MKLVIGLATQAANDPLIANTMSMAKRSKFDRMFHFSFNPAKNFCFPKPLFFGKGKKQKTLEKKSTQ